MSKFRIAHLHEQGNDIIIVPLDTGFGRQSTQQQHEIIEQLQICASQAGLRGTVVPVWQSGNSHRFIAPQQWHAFFTNFSWNDIMANINRELTCH